MKSSPLLLLAGALALGAPAVSLSAPAAAPSEAPMLALTVGGVGQDAPDLDARLDVMKAMGVTSIQTYVYWNHIEKTPGVRDWSEYDEELARYRRHGLRWVPFVVAGPWYMTPDFIRGDPSIPMLRCVEHGRASAIPSIWSDAWRDRVRTYLKAFAEHYRPTGAIESVNIGIGGDYGEAIYSVIGNWPGEYHSHQGFWCGDALAVADFRRHLRGLYPAGIGALNAAWQAHYASFDDVRPFTQVQAPSERAWQEFLGWYRDSMTAYAEFWLRTTRDLFPGTDIYLCTGGDMAPEHGSDFSAQAKVAAKYGAGVRITNEASSFPMNVRLTRMVDSAGRFYGAYFGHEPASAVTPVGVLGRLFNAVTSGGRQLFTYDNPELVETRDGKSAPGEAGRFIQKYRPLMHVTSPEIETALYWPRPPQAQNPADWNNFGQMIGDIRRFIDYDLVDDRMIEDGALKQKRILIVSGARVMDTATVARIKEWVRGGGVAFLLDSRATDWDARTAPVDDLLGLTPESDQAVGITELKVRTPRLLPEVSALKSVFVTLGYTHLQPDCEVLLGMNYTDTAGVAWRRRLGAGMIYTYFGPMDLKQEEQSWMVAQQVPLHFLRDCIQTSIADKLLKSAPGSLNMGQRDLYKVQCGSGVWILNAATQAQTVDVDGKPVSVPPTSITAP